MYDKKLSKLDDKFHQFLPDQGYLDSLKEAKLWLETATGVTANEVQIVRLQILDGMDIHQLNPFWGKLLELNYLQVLMKIFLLVKSETIKNESDITSTTQTMAIGFTVFLLLTDLSHMMYKNVKFYISMRNLDFDQNKCSISYSGILFGVGFGVLVVKLGVALVWHFTQSHKTILDTTALSCSANFIGSLAG